MKIRKGDMVQVLTGKDRGKRGEVMRAIPKRDKVIVDGVNQVKKHQRATKATMQGGIIDKDMPLPVANVAIVCGTCGPTRIGYSFEGSADGKQDRANKKRICRKCGGEL